MALPLRPHTPHLLRELAPVFVRDRETSRAPVVRPVFRSFEYHEVLGPVVGPSMV
jgi:hypothetical protein